MPSPFPGMDPYLEDPVLWPDVHHELISAVREQLGGQLRPKYFVRVEERVYVSDEDDPGRTVIIPDLRIADRPGAGGRRVEPAEPQEDAGGGAIVAAPLVAVTRIRDEIREARVEVVDAIDRHVVTVIEFLSPSNKVPGSRGQASYLQKRDEVMDSSAHWVEVDLLRAGHRPLPRGVLPACDYFAHVSRMQKRPRGLLWPILLTQRLPVLPVPLRGDDPDAKLDLQAALTTAYDRAGYDLQVDYRKPPAPPPLDEPRAKWVAELLAGKGLR